MYSYTVGIQEEWRNINGEDILMYQCPICETYFESEDDAYNCRDTHNDPEYMEKYVDYDPADK